MSKIPIIFISYAGEELHYADYIRKVLSKRVGDRAKVFVAKRDISSGDNPNKVMLYENLLGSTAIIPICSAISKKSQWLWWETSAVWAKKGEVIPLYAHTSPEDFGQPSSSLFQGKTFFEAEELEKMMKDLFIKLSIDVKNIELDSEEREELMKLSKTKILASEHELKVAFTKTNQITQEKHIYLLDVSLSNRGQKKFNDVNLVLDFPTIALEEKKYSQLHFRSRKADEDYTEITFSFSSMNEPGQKQFQSDLLPRRTLKILGSDGINNFRYIVTREIFHQSNNLQLRWKLYIDGFLCEEKSKNFSDFMEF